MSQFKEILILSGKGGTGKTSITAGLASIVKNEAIYVDCDVDASNLHLILQPSIKETNIFKGGWTCSINSNKCINCGLCNIHCQFNAIEFDHGYQINAFKCEGCKLCEKICPQSAIISNQSLENYWYVSSTRFGKFIHAKMKPGEENSGKLVTEIRKTAIEQLTKEKFIIIDGPPGIGCSTIASMSNTDAILIIFEPTLSGLHDGERLIELAQTMNCNLYAIINKYDINLNVTDQITKSMENLNIPLIGKIPFDQEILTALINNQSIIEYQPSSKISNILKKVWEQII